MNNENKPMTTEVNLSTEQAKKQEEIEKVYTYQSGSKIEKLPKWAKILISCGLVLLAVGSVVGGAFAIKAVRDQTISNKQ